MESVKWLIAIGFAIAVIVVSLAVAVSIDAGTTSQPGQQTYEDAVTLHVSGAETDTGTGTVIGALPGGINGVILTLDVTAAATASDDTLDVFVQTRVDGTNWLDVAHFTQVLGNGGAKRYVDKIHAHGDVTLFETGSALSESAQRDLIGNGWRCRWVIVDASTDDASFTFSIVATPM
jgi:hypothetical protein